MTSSEAMLPSGSRKVLLFHHDLVESARLVELLSRHGFSVTVCEVADMALAVLYSDPADLAVVPHDFPPRGGLALAAMLKADNVFAHLPILYLATPSTRQILCENEDSPIDDFVNSDDPPEDLVIRARLAISRVHRQLDANPLTRLPGNNSIARELVSRLARRDDFSTVYVDLDNFKAFNDRYGFSRGDEALRLTARLLLSCSSGMSPRDYFVGHVGGDDFVLLLPAEKAEAVCGHIIANFDAIVPSLYDDEDRQRSSISSTNRRGERETFPLMSISLAVIPNTGGRFTHPGQVSAAAADLKKHLKTIPGSKYLQDRRSQSPVGEW